MISGYSKYFNTASISPMMPHVRVAIDAFLDRYMTADFAYYEELQKLSSSIRTNAAQIVGANADDMAMFPNSASAVSAIMMGYPFEDGDHIIVVENDFPSVSLPLTSLRKEKQLQVTILDQGSFYKDPVGVLKAAITPQTRLFASSYVGYMSGMSIPLQEISALCQQHHVHFIVDATQAVVVLPIQCNDWGLDAVIFSTYKWMQAPIGVALGAISPKFRSLLSPSVAGWLSTADTTQMMTIDAPFSKTASMFEPGGRAILAMIGLEASLTFLTKTGLETIRQKAWENSRSLLTALAKRGFKIFCNKDLEQCSGIVSVDCAPEMDGLFDYLLSKGYRLTSRQGLLRFSVYYFHQEEDVLALLSEIDAFLASK